MKLPDGLLRKQFVTQLVRGAIIRFEFAEWSDPSKTSPGPKFAIVLNADGVHDPVYLMLVTSKADKYDAPHFDGVVIRVAAGDYECFAVKSAIPFRNDPTAMPREKLEQQIIAGKLLFVGKLSEVHMEKMDAIIKDGVHISAHLIPFISA